MACKLGQMECILSDYSKALSKILNVDVDIVSDNLIRIAGTGIYENQIGCDISSKGFIYSKAIETKKMQVVYSPRKDNLCKDCPEREVCKECFEMAMPIILNSEVIGVIGLVCFDEKRKKRIINDLDNLRDFIMMYSDLIASKVKEFHDNEQNRKVIKVLEAIVDKIEEGVIVYSHNNLATSMNSIAKQILKLDVNDLNESTNIIYETAEEIQNRKEFILESINGTTILAGNMYDINIEEYKKIFIFKDANRVREEVFALKSLNDSKGLNKIIGKSSAIIDLKKRIQVVAKLNSTILITGESGTGKELVARALHEESDRADEPFVAINCGAIPESLIESELFGYVSGAFTGANSNGKIGKFEMANKGTLFLDEIGDLPLFVQVKLLRIIESKVLTRLGSNDAIDINVRIIAATNRNLFEMVQQGDYREDLYYRLNVIPLQLPPLRNRGYDIRLLGNYFIEKYSQMLGKKVITIEESFWNEVMRYGWPGNIRELQNTIEFVISLLDCNGSIKKSHLPSRITSYHVDEVHAFESLNLESIEKVIIKKALDRHPSTSINKNDVACELGIGIATLYRKIKKYGIEIIE